MPDYFAVLKQPRRPWLDDAALKEKFLELSGETHPDRVCPPTIAEKQNATDQFSEVNSAFNRLRDPKSRLRHLFELETGGKLKDVQQVPSELSDLFMEIAQACRAVDEFLAERPETAPPLLKVELFERAQDWSEKLKPLQKKLQARFEVLNRQLKLLNAAWENAPASGLERVTSLPLTQLESIAREFGYLSRWMGQLQERAVQLML